VPSEVEHRDGDARDAYVFQHTYHTMFVAGLLSATLLRSLPVSPAQDGVDDLSPLAEIADRCEAAAARTFSSRAAEADVGDSTQPDRARCFEAACEILTELEPRHRWWRTLLTAGSRENLRMIVDAALIAAARCYDLGRLIALLDDAILLDGALSPTLLEAIDFVLRQQLPGGLFCAQFVEPTLRADPSARKVAEAVATSLRRYAVRLRTIGVDAGFGAKCASA
jgi:hypothetical protein